MNTFNIGGSQGPFKTAEECLGAEPKPTVAQAAWVLRCVSEALNAPGGCSYRGLIYGIMDYSEEAYISLYDAGGMRLTNVLYQRNQEESAK